MPFSTSREIPILQCVNDAHFFWRKDIDEAFSLKWILNCFKEWPSLPINLCKSSLLPLGSRSQMTTLLAYIFNCVEEFYPIWYLGVPLRPRRPKSWLLFIKKIDRRLARWKGRSLSLGGASLSSMQCFIPSQ